MQLLNSPEQERFQAIEAAIQAERLERYYPAAEGNKEAAFRFYLWNCALCEAFFISLHFAEIVCRNAIHQRIQQRLGERWFENPTFNSILGERFRDELNAAISDERLQHGERMTAHHIVSALTFAFWQHLMTKRFERLFWADGLRQSFPFLPNRIGRQELHDHIESVRRWRNRIAHHRAIFDKGPSAKHQEAIHIIMWACDRTGDWVASISRVPTALGLRPSI